MSKFLSEKLSGLIPYTPGEQPQDKNYIKLNTNESPFSPSSKVIEAITVDELSKLNLYSDPTSNKLIQSIANFYKIQEDNIFVGNGSDEVLAFIFYAFCDKNIGMAYPEIGYSFYPVYCDLFNIPKIEIEVEKDFSINLDKFKGVNHNIIFANPNAQTGLYLSVLDIKALLLENKDKLIIIDEAYCDFGGDSAVSLIDEFDNLIVVSTLSKSRQLAGARLGYCVASKEIVADLNMIKFSFNPYNINRLSLIAGEKAFCDKKFFDFTRDKIIENREWLKVELKKMGFDVSNSLANFILVSKSGISGKELYIALKEKGILVRFLSDKKLENFVRITIGSKSQMETLVVTMKEIIKENDL